MRIRHSPCRFSANSFPRIMPVPVAQAQIEGSLPRRLPRQETVSQSGSPRQGTLIRLALTLPGAPGDDAVNRLRSEVCVRRRAENQRNV